MEEVAALTQWTTADPVLEAREGEAVEAEAALVELYESEWGDLGFEVTRAMGDRPDVWRLASDRWVGVARLPERGSQSRQLRIAPKVDADVFFLADYAFGSQRNKISELRLDAHVAAIGRDPAAQLVAWFLAELEAFVMRHLRRDYVVQQEVFEGRIRGRLLMSRYAQRYLACGSGHRAPCQFFDFTQDNLANQILKRSLRELRRLAGLTPLPEVRRELVDWADRILPFVGAVSDTAIHPADFNRLRLRASMRHYRPILAKCRALLGHTYIATEAGQHVQDAFLWNMPTLFETALRGVLRTTPGVSMLPRGGKAMIVDADGTPLTSSAVSPDFVLSYQAQRFVLDAKYKDTRIAAQTEDVVVEIEVAQGQPIRVSRRDVYQAIAYGQHDTYRPAMIGLVYPVVVAEGQEVPAPHRVTGFSEDVWLLFVDVGAFARENVERFRQDMLEPLGAPLRVAAA